MCIVKMLSVWRGVVLLPGRIKREKGVRGMPWQQEAMKDVIPCDKPWPAGNGRDEPRISEWGNPPDLSGIFRLNP